MRNPFHRRSKVSFSSSSSPDTSLPNISGSGFDPSSGAGAGSASASAFAASTASMIARSPPVSLSPGDKPMSFPPGYTVSPGEIRALNDLIRKRYTLDATIWRLRDCKPCDRKEVEEMMGRADATLARIRATVKAWDTSEVWKEETDWERLKMIHQRLESGGKRVWAGNPPWRR